jgi:diaminopimelate epimerase
MPSSAKPPLYDARGNTYVVATPDQVAQVASLPSRISHAARHHQAWSQEAIHAFCSRRSRGIKILQRSQSKPFVSNGLLVGPFRCPEGFGLLIVNTDATLAERSGNGLTIFAQYLLDSNLVEGKIEFPVAVYHSNSPSKPIVATCRQATRYQQSGIWVDMGTPTFGPGSVGAAPNSNSLRAAERFYLAGHHESLIPVRLSVRRISDYVSANAPRVSVVTATRCFAGRFGGPTRRRDSAATNSAFGIGLANR